MTRPTLQGLRVSRHDEVLALVAKDSNLVHFFEGPGKLKFHPRSNRVRGSGIRGGEQQPWMARLVNATGKLTDRPHRQGAQLTSYQFPDLDELELS